MEVIEKLTNKVIYELSQQPENKTPEIIRRLIAYEAQNPLTPVELSSDDIEEIAKEVEHKFGLTMEEGILIVDDENFEPWLPDKKSHESFEPYFWSRYEKLLLQRGFAPPVVSSIDNVTDKVVGRLEDPDKKGHWYRRGMVVGYVQSGKTANFIGVINKASDVGYKLIIILAGMQESLRSQTQERVDEGYIGQDSGKKKNVSSSETLIGVGHFDSKRRPVTFTDIHNDFKSTDTFQVQEYNNATVLVVKKNTSVLAKLRDWLKKNNSNMNGNISSLPLLMIDDEADHASVNTNDADKDPTRINERIREILHLFDRKCYLAYTATPFANIFIDPNTTDEMLGDELFPRDFIVSLDPPSNYVGSEKIFGSDSDGIDIVRDIGDIEDIIPLKHQKIQTISELPKSLKNAVYSHIVSKAIRLLRGQENKHHSMLIHVSRYKDVQKEVYNCIVQMRQDIEKGVRYSYKLDTKDALKNVYMKNLFDIWNIDFKEAYSEWNNVQEKLLEAAASMQVMVINGDSGDNLDYQGYKNGLNVIAVGGDKLSRGLTLEGLATSYFYRNTSMYDTLMQMGRWFGYRDGYADLCRVYLTPMTENYFSHISNATEELRNELKEMFAHNLTPKEFGLKVRTHPGSLLITARNKMRSAQTLTIRLDLNGKLVESYALDVTEPNRKNNWKLLEKLIANMEVMYRYNEQKNYEWNDVPQEKIADFIKQFSNHPASQMTASKPILNYLRQTSSLYPYWDIVLVNIENSREIDVSGIPVSVQKRSCPTQKNSSYIEISKRRRVGNNRTERAGMGKTEIEKALKRYGKDDISVDIPGLFLRMERSKPLLMLHVVDAYKDIKDEKTLLEQGLFAYGISFPKSSVYIEPVEFAVNTVYAMNNVEEDEDEE
ncbi:MAG: Z1 domain-containing protein [Nitrospirae bacterium]|nr:Z1 domain-containing protein [Nitrospirota bacterium]